MSNCYGMIWWHPAECDKKVTATIILLLRAIMCKKLHEIVIGARSFGKIIDLPIFMCEPSLCILLNVRHGLQQLVYVLRFKL